MEKWLEEIKLVKVGKEYFMEAGNDQKKKKRIWRNLFVIQKVQGCIVWD